MSRFIETIEVSTAHELLAWTETHEYIPAVEWPVDAAAGTADDDRFILAVPTRAGLVGFFALTEADADRIRASVF